MRGEDVIGLSILAVGILILVYAFIQRMSARKWGENPSGIGQVFKRRTR